MKLRRPLSMHENRFVPPNFKRINECGGQDFIRTPNLTDFRGIENNWLDERVDVQQPHLLFLKYSSAVSMNSGDTRIDQNCSTSSFRLDAERVKTSSIAWMSLVTHRGRPLLWFSEMLSATRMPVLLAESHPLTEHSREEEVRKILMLQIEMDRRRGPA
jgi:hypothetical protein